MAKKKKRDGEEVRRRLQARVNGGPQEPVKCSHCGEINPNPSQKHCILPDPPPQSAFVEFLKTRNAPPEDVFVSGEYPSGEDPSPFSVTKEEITEQNNKIASLLATKKKKAGLVCLYNIQLEETIKVLEKRGEFTDPVESGEKNPPSVEEFKKAKGEMTNEGARVQDLAEQCLEMKNNMDEMQDRWAFTTTKKHREKQQLDAMFSMADQKRKNNTKIYLGRRVLIMGMRYLECLLINLKSKEKILQARPSGLPLQEWNLVASQHKNLLESKLKLQEVLTETSIHREKKLKDLTAERDQLDVTIATKTIEVTSSLEERFTRIMKAQAYKGAEKSSRDYQSYIENEKECIERLNKECEDICKRVERFNNKEYHPRVTKQVLDGADEKIKELSNMVIDLKAEIPALEMLKRNFPELEKELIHRILLEEEKQEQIKAHHKQSKLELSITKENLLAAIRQRGEYSKKLGILTSHYVRMCGSNQTNVHPLQLSTPTVVQ